MKWIKALFGKRDGPSEFQYNGQSVDELIALLDAGHDRPDLLAWGLYSALSEKEDKGAAAMTDSERSVLAVLKLGHELDNGGFHQYLFNTGGKHLPFAENALRDMGRQDVATLLSKAVDLAGLKSPYDMDEVQETMVAASDETDEGLERLDSEYFETGDLFESVWPFVLAQRSQINL